MRKNSFYFQWHITDFCGNRCEHCYINEFNKNRVSLVAAKNILADMKDCCVELDADMILSITGGDPLTHPEIWTILNEARTIAGKLAVLGNPELVNDKNIHKLKAAGINWYQLSLDGLEMTHDRIRSKGSFKRTIKGIKLLTATGIPVVINSTVSGTNYREMVDVMKLSHDLGASKWSFARWVPDSGTCGMSAVEYRKFLEKICTEQKAYNEDATGFVAGDSLMYPVISEPMNCDSIVGGCALGSSVLCILPDNTVMACRRHKDSVLGKWQLGGDLLDFFLFNPKMEEYRQTEKIIGCSKCSFKSQCRGCRAVAFADSGNTLGRDPQCVLISNHVS
ncbi:MAG: radical SAM protein [Candidatus Moranbacteria bacterium]|nr:radical SAM protein [Candidatus Moranbacteria bacterium]